MTTTGILVGLILFTVTTSSLQAKDSAVLWHSLNGKPAELLRQFIFEFNRKHPGALREETGIDLIPALLTQMETGTLPDAVLAPSDVIGIVKKVNGSRIPHDFVHQPMSPEVRSTVSIGGIPWGVPILDGNTLLLMYNRRRFREEKPQGRDWAIPARLLQDFAARFSGPSSRSLPVAWKFDEPYLFLAFASAYGVRPESESIDLAAPAVTRALEEYQQLGRSFPVLAKCGYDCVAERFYRGEFSAVINGDWALDAAIQVLGPDLGVAPLPIFGTGKMRSLRATHALFFPGQSLSGPRGKVLKEFSQFLTLKKNQKRWQDFAHRVPANTTLQEEMAHHENPLDQALIQALEQSTVIPSSEQMLVLWQALGKGLHLLLNGTLSVKESQEYMVSLIQSPSSK